MAVAKGTALCRCRQPRQMDYSTRVNMCNTILLRIKNGVSRRTDVQCSVGLCVCVCVCVCVSSWDESKRISVHMQHKAINLSVPFIKESETACV